MPPTWLLLIYTIPAEPSRKRAYAWRELKKAGAIYLRDGVCALPENQNTAVEFRRIAAKIVELGGQATVGEGVRLDETRAAAVVEQMRTARSAEFSEVARDAERFLAYLASEAGHRDFIFAELEELEQDLGKLRRWTDQIRTRDHFNAEGGAVGVGALLTRCDEALATFLEEASRREEAAR